MADTRAADEPALLDAYSLTVAGVAETVGPAVCALACAAAAAAPAWCCRRTG